MHNVSRVALQPAYLLHSRPYRDTSLLLEVLNSDFGRLGVVAKGVRGRRRSPLTGLLQPFQPLLLSWAGRGELVTLREAESAACVPPLNGNNLFAGLYLNELLMRLLPRHNVIDGLYSRYSRTLEVLMAGGEIAWALRLFERDLLAGLGYGLQLTHCAESGEVIEATAQYCYHPELGPVPIDHTRHGGVVVGGETLLALHTGEPPARVGLLESKRLMRTVLARYLGDRPLMSREMLRDTMVNGIKR